MKPPDSSAFPLPVANPAQPARPDRYTVRIPPGHAGCFSEFATEKGPGGRIRRFMNSPG